MSLVCKNCGNYVLGKYCGKCGSDDIFVPKCGWCEAEVEFVSESYCKCCGKRWASSPKKERQQKKFAGILALIIGGFLMPLGFVANRTQKMIQLTDNYHPPPVILGVILIIFFLIFGSILVFIGIRCLKEARRL